MSEGTFRRLFPHRPFTPSTLELRTYTGEPMDIVGEVSVRVRYQQQQLQERGEGPTLLGRNWLKYLQLEWGSIKAVLTQTSRSPQ